MKIYTKKGDDGKTMLLGGTRLPKHHIRIAAYGDIDELNSFIGLVADLLPSHQQILREIQNNLFVVGSHFATEPDQAEQPSTQIARMVLPSCFGGEKLKKPVKAKVPLDSEDPILALLK